MYGDFICICICVPRKFLVPMEPEEGIRSSATKATKDCKPPCWCYELNLGSLEEQPALLTTESSLSLPKSYFFIEKDTLHLPISQLSICIVF